MIDPLSIQDRLNRGGEVVLPAGDYFPQYPLFVPSDTTVRGADRFSRVSCERSGSAFVVGWRLGLVSADHFPPGGFRTHGNTSLMGSGTDWDLGPVGGWPAVHRLNVSFAAVAHSSPSGTWDGCGLCGMVADPHVTDTDGSLSGGSYFGPRPAPFCVTVEGGNLVVYVGTTDPWPDCYRVFRFLIDQTYPVLNVRITIDADAGSVSVLSAPSSVDRFDAPVQLVRVPDGKTLSPFTFAPNHLWPFHAGRLDPYFSSDGYWGGDRYDATIRLCGMSCDRGPAAGWRVNTLGSGTDFPGVLPLARCNDGNTRYLLIPFKGQGIPDTATRSILRDVTIRGQAGNPNIYLGCVLNCEFDHVWAAGGTRGISATSLAVNYPLHVDRCQFTGHSDRNAFFTRTSWIDIRRTLFEQGLRAAVTFVHCGGIVDNSPVFPAPGPAGRQDTVFDQIGGAMTYNRIAADYEGEYRPGAFLTVTPTSLEQGFYPTAFRLVDCSPGGVPSDPARSPMVRVRKAAGWYTAPITGKIDASDPRETRVVCEEPRAVMFGDAELVQ